MPTESLYQNVWVHGDYVYHTAVSGIDVYNSTVSTKLSEIIVPAYDQEKRVRVDFNKPTTYNDHDVPVTISAGNIVYSYTLTGNDIHFKDASANELGFWVEDWNFAATSEMWVRVPPSGTSYVYMYFDHDANLDFEHGSPHDVYLFYDDFSVVYPGTTGLSTDWTIPAEDESQFLVSGGKLRVTGQQAGTGVYADASVEIDKGYNFQNPLSVEVSLTNVYRPGSVGDGYNQFYIRFDGGAQGGDAWGWYDEGTYNQRVRHGNGSAFWTYGSNIGMLAEDSLMTVHFTVDYTRAIADRATNPFDITYSGSNRTPEASVFRVFTAHDFAYDANYVKVGRWDDTFGTTTSGVETVNYPTSSPAAVWADDYTVYIGTTNAGVYTAPVATISGNSTVTGSAYKKYPNLTSDEVTYLHGAGDYLCVSTAAGVDRYNTVSGTRIYTSRDATHKCFQTTSGTLYYIENNLFLESTAPPSGLGGGFSDWQYYQTLYFSSTSAANDNVRVTFGIDFPYQNTNPDGGDIRFIDDNGNNLVYYIEDWYPNATVLVKVPIIGTNRFHMIYGNSSAVSQSSTDAYHFYDDFTTVDTSVWQVNARNSGYVTSNGEYLTIKDSNNNGTEIITKEKIPYGLFIEARYRRGASNSLGQYDGVIGFCTSTSNVSTKRGYVKIDPTQGSDETLHFLHAYDTSILGTKPISPDWKVWEGLWAPGYQRSYYDGETLERNSTNSIFEADNYFFFHQNCGTSNPAMEVDWVRMTTWPERNTYTGTEGSLWELIKPKLHVVYNPTSNWTEADYVYEEFYGDPLILNDIHVTEETSAYNNDNTIFLGTDRGAHVIEERQGSEENANSKRYYLS